MMRSEKDKMLAGELYDPMDPELVRGRDRARELCQDLNATREAQQDERRRILSELFGSGGRDGLDAAAVLLRRVQTVWLRAWHAHAAPSSWVGVLLRI